MINIAFLHSMGWYIGERYCCLELDQIVNDTWLDELLNEYAAQIWTCLDSNVDTPDHLQCIREELVGNQEADIEMISDEVRAYISIEHLGSGKSSMLIRCQSEDSNCDVDLFEDVCKFFFLRSSESHLLIRSAEFDKGGGYSHQWVGCYKDGEIVVKNTDDFFDDFFRCDLWRQLV